MHTDVVGDRARLDDPGPAVHAGNAIAAFPLGALFTAKRCRAAVSEEKLGRRCRLNT